MLPGSGSINYLYMAYILWPFGAVQPSKYRLPHAVVLDVFPQGAGDSWIEEFTLQGFWPFLLSGGGFVWRLDHVTIR